MAGVEIKDYELSDGRTVRCRYDRLGMAKISRETMESFVKEVNASYRQAIILEHIIKNYGIARADMVSDLQKMRDEISEQDGEYFALDDGTNKLPSELYVTMEQILAIVDKYIEKSGKWGKGMLKPKEGVKMSWSWIP